MLHDGVWEQPGSQVSLSGAHVGDTDASLSPDACLWLTDAWRQKVRLGRGALLAQLRARRAHLTEAAMLGLSASVPLCKGEVAWCCKGDWDLSSINRGSDIEV